jgi:hypothetical protein
MASDVLACFYRPKEHLLWGIFWHFRLLYHLSALLGKRKVASYYAAILRTREGLESCYILYSPLCCL